MCKKWEGIVAGVKESKILCCKSAEVVTLWMVVMVMSKSEFWQRVPRKQHNGTVCTWSVGALTPLIKEQRQYAQKVIRGQLLPHGKTEHNAKCLTHSDGVMLYSPRFHHLFSRCDRKCAFYNKFHVSLVQT